jgi:hypothetical protein
LEVPKVFMSVVDQNHNAKNVSPLRIEDEDAGFYFSLKRRRARMGVAGDETPDPVTLPPPTSTEATPEERLDHCAMTCFLGSGGAACRPCDSACQRCAETKVARFGQVWARLRLRSLASTWGITLVNPQKGLRYEVQTSSEARKEALMTAKTRPVDGIFIAEYERATSVMSCSASPAIWT